MIWNKTISVVIFLIGIKSILENNEGTLEYEEIVLPPLTFVVDPIMNLMSKLYYEYERIEHHSPCTIIIILNFYRHPYYVIGFSSLIVR